MDRAANGELTCVAGDMGLSKKMEEALLSRFGLKVKVDAPLPESGASWFCPACRIALGDDMTCADCGGSLKPFHFQLVEIHPHENWPSSRVIH